jgi:hypothetical protein
MLQQLVRCNLQHDLQVVLGWCDRLRDHVATAGGRRMLERIELTAEYAREFAAETEQLEHAIERDGELETRTVDVTQLLEHELLKTSCQCSAFTYEYPEQPAPALVEANALLGRALGTLLHTTARDTDGETELSVSFERTATTVETNIVVHGGLETTALQLEEQPHSRCGEGFDIDLVWQVIAAFDGELSVAKRQTETTVTVELPLTADHTPSS